MTRTKAAPAASRPMPPRPSSGGSWRFDADAWAYVRAGQPMPEPPVEPAFEPPVDTAPKETGK